MKKSPRAFGLKEKNVVFQVARLTLQNTPDPKKTTTFFCVM
jgi:hypothetical protein